MWIAIKTYNSATGTLWSWNNIKRSFSISYELKEKAWWIVSMTDFYDYYNNWEKRWKTRLLNRLNTYKNWLKKKFGIDIDPIEYLLFLYFKEGKSIEDIFYSENNKWLNYKNDTCLWKLFKDTFWWKLRDTAWSKLTKKKREAIKEKQVSWLKASNLEKSKEKRKLLVSKIKDLVKDILWPLPEFIKEDFLNKRNKPEKIIYTLKSLNWMDEKHIQELYNSWLWSRVLADYFWKLINDFLRKYNLEINIFPKDILAIAKK